MATTFTKPNIEGSNRFPGADVPAWPRGDAAPESNDPLDLEYLSQRPSRRDALQALLAFSALHEQVRRRKALAAEHISFDRGEAASEFDPSEQFVLDDVLQLVAERAVAITGADGLAIALAENNEIVLRASAGVIKPGIGARIDRDSAFSGACFRRAEIVRCDDTETDPRVNRDACRDLGARSMVAVPLCGRRRVIGLLEAFSADAFAFNEGDVRNLSLLAELVLGALKPEDEDRFAESAQAAEAKLEPLAKPGFEVPAKPNALATRAVEEERLHRSPLEDEPVLEEVSDPPLGAIDSEPANSENEILDRLTLKSVAQEESVLPETQVATDAGLDEAVPREHSPGVFLLLVFVVIASLLGGGFWWKLKNAQLGSAMVETQKLQNERAQTPKPIAKPAAPASSAVPANDTQSDAADESDSETTAATPQEMSKMPQVTGIRHWSSADSTTVVLDVQDQVQYEAHRLSGPDRIYFDLRDTALAPELKGKTVEVGDALLSRIRVAQPVAGMTRVVLETKGNSNFSVSLEPNPYRLVVQVRKVGADAKGAVNLFPNAAEAEKSKLAIVVPPPTKEDQALRAHVSKLRIVVDAGHGGWDLGTVGRRGLLEKDLVLEIAQRLGKLLESRLGAEIVYTRKDDNYVPLDERAGIANQSQADLFVSVHANYSDLPSARGVETYYTNFFSAPNSKDAESHAAGAKPASATVAPIDLHDKIEQSRRLAASVQHSLYGTLSAQNPGLRDRGIKEAGFVVLTETSMPGILAEVSFVSSPTDEQKLRSDGYREQIAEALYKGIARYAATSHGVKVAERQPLAVSR